MNKTMNTAVMAALTLGLLAPVRIVLADTPADKHFEQAHPRRDEINDRVRHQRLLLKKQLKDGKITQAQYDQQMASLKNVKTQEVADVKANGGYVTKDQQKALNQELNQNRKEIHQDVTSNGGGTAAPATPAPAGQ